MKKLINDPADVVAESLQGLRGGARRPRARQPRPGLHRPRRRPGRRARSGSSRAAAPGTSRCTAASWAWACSTWPARARSSPPPRPTRCYEATKAVDGGAGVLHIVKNYTGDVLNFEMAADLARADGIEVEAVITNDDVAVQDSLYTAGRRGVGVTVLAEKIVGAAAEEGKDLAAVAELCRRVNAEGRSMGMALTSCTVPAAGTPTFELGEDEMEIGIGIHGEPGRERLPLASGAARSWSASPSPILDDLPFASGDQVLAFVNGMGGTPQIELYLVYNELRHAARRARDHDRAQPGRPVHHVARDGRDARSPCSGSTTSSPACGTRRCTPPACGGAHERPDRAGAITAGEVAALAARLRRRRWRGRRTS